MTKTPKGMPTKPKNAAKKKAKPASGASFDMEEIVIVLGEGTREERTFRPSSKTTFEQDLFLMDIFEESGVGSIMDHIRATDMELSEVGMRIIRQAYRSGQLFLLLGGVLVEDGKKWSEEVAHRNAEYFANLDDPSDKEALHGPVASVVMSFFLNALESSTTSRKSLSRSELETLLTSVGARPKGGKHNGDDPLIEELFTSANGTAQ